MQKNDRMKMMIDEPVYRAMLKMSLPMMASFFIQAMYNIVDSMFVARISEEALTAVSLAFPMQQIVTAISVGTSTGVSAVWSRYMGMGRKDKASAAIHSMNGMSLLFTLVFIVLGLCATGPLYSAQTGVASIAEMGTVYLTINWVLSCGAFFGKYYERMLVSAGRATLSMAAMASGAVFNLIFDPLLIFGIGFFPEMGIAGAAYATVGGQIFATVVAYVLNRKYNSAIEPDLHRFRLEKEPAADILRVGLPSIITMGLSSLTSFFINQILLAYSTTATAVYGVWMKLQNFCYMPVFGLNNGMVPLLSYNYGAKRIDRVQTGMNLALAASAALMGVLTVIFELIPGTILTMFSAGEQMRTIGMVCLRATVVSLPFGAVSMIMSTSMQALDHSRYSMVINLLRQCFLLIGCFALLSALTHSQLLIWIAVPVTEVVTFCVAALLYRRFRKRMISRQNGH